MQTGMKIKTRVLQSTHHLCFIAKHFRDLQVSPLRKESNETKNPAETKTVKQMCWAGKSP